MTQQFIEQVNNFTRGNPQMKLEAERYLTELSHHTESFQIAIQVLQLTDQQIVNDPFIHYFALKLIEDGFKCNTSTDDTKKNMITTLINWVLSTKRQQIAIRKCAQIIILLLFFMNNKNPTEWSQIVVFILSRGNTLENKYFILSILNEIDNQLIDYARTHNAVNQLSNAVKDSMRETCINKVAEFFFNCFRDEEVIKNYSLEVFSKYVSWIDIGISTNTQVLQVVYSLLNGNTLANAMKVFYEIFNKGMPPLNKLQLVMNLNLIKQFPSNVTSDDDLFEILTKFVALILNELVEGFATLYPLKGRPKGSVQIDPNVFQVYKQMMNIHFAYFIQLFMKSNLLQIRTFSDVITTTISGFYSVLMNDYINPQEFIGLTKQLYQSVVQRYGVFFMEGVDEDMISIVDTVNAMRNIYWSSMSIDMNLMSLVALFEEMNKVNTNPSQANSVTISTEAFLLYQFNEEYLKIENANVWFKNTLNGFVHIMMKVIGQVNEDSPIFSLLKKYMKLIPHQTIIEMAEYFIANITTFKSPDRIEEFFVNGRDIGMKTKDEWIVGICTKLKQSDDSIWTSQQFIDESEYYKLLGVMMEGSNDPLVSSVINSLFIYQINHFEELFVKGNGMNTLFVTNYFARKIENIGFYMDKLRNKKCNSLYQLVNKMIEIIKRLIEGIATGGMKNIEVELIKKPIVTFTQQWIGVLSPQFTIIPPFGVYSKMYSNSYENMMLLSQMIIHLSNRQEQMKTNLMNQEVIGVINELFKFAMDITTLGDRYSELFREKEEVLFNVIQMMNLPFECYEMYKYFNLAKMNELLYGVMAYTKNANYIKIIGKYCLKHIEYDCMNKVSTSVAGELNTYIDMFVTLIMQQNKEKVPSSLVSCVDLLKKLHNLCSRGGDIVLQAFNGYIKLNNQKSQWIANVINELSKVKQNQINVPLVTKLLNFMN